MNTKIISIRKLLILFTVILVFGSTVKVEASTLITPTISGGYIDLTTGGANCGSAGYPETYVVYRGNYSDMSATSTTYGLLNYPQCGGSITIDYDFDGYGASYYWLYNAREDIYLEWYFNGTTGSIETNTTTRIIELLPEHGTTTASTTVEVKLNIYINEEDIGSFFGVKINLSTVDLNNFYFQNIAELNDPTDYIIDNIQATTTGNLTWTFTRELPEGNYLVEAQLYKSYFWGVLQNSLFPIDNKSHSFTVIEGTKLGKITTGIIDIFGGMNSTTSSSTIEILTSACSPFTTDISTAFLNTNWSIIECLTYLIYPPKPLVKEKLMDIAENLTTKFPLGYVNDLYMILSTTSSSTLAVIDATMPSALGFGSGHRVVLDITHVLDPILNATTSIFSGDNPNTDSTETLYEYTSKYWDKLIYLATLFYVIGRIIGSTIIPNINPAGEVKSRGILERKRQLKPIKK